MSRSIEFFSRQTLAGDSAADVDYYSPMFDVTDLQTLDVDVIVYANSGTGASSEVSVQIEECEDPYMNDAAWASLGSAITQQGSGHPTKVQLSDPLRFVRAKATIKSGHYATIAAGACARTP